MTCSRTAARLAALSLVAAAPHADVLVVDAAGGPGSEFTDLQVAIDEAVEGDILLVRSGSYSAGPGAEIEVVEKGLTIVEDSGATATVTSPVYIDNEDFTGPFLWRGIDVVVDSGLDGAFEYRGFAPLWAEDAVIRKLTGASLDPAVIAGSGGGAQVWSRCTVRGKSPATDDPGGTGVVSFSNSAWFDCFVRGGDAQDDIGQAANTGKEGGTALFEPAGLTVTYAQGSEIRGGDGGDGRAGGPLSGCTSGGDGGDGVFLNLISLDSTVVPGSGGAGGSPGGCFTGSPGEAVVATHTVLSGSARSLEATAVVREGETLELAYEGVPGDVVFLALSPSAGFLYDASIHGVSVLGLPTRVIFQGVVPAGGSLLRTPTLGELGAGIDGVRVNFQPVFATATDLTVGAPSATVLLDASF